MPFAVRGDLAFSFASENWHGRLSSRALHYRQVPHLVMVACHRSLISSLGYISRQILNQPSGGG